MAARRVASACAWASRTATGKPTTFVAGLTLRGAIAPFALSGPTNRDAFETYVERVLVPELRSGDIVVMDNLSSHKGSKTQAPIEAAGARLLFLPPHSPDFNPIENAFGPAQGAAPQGRRTKRRGPLGRHRPPRRHLHPDRVPNYFVAAGCDPDR